MSFIGAAIGFFVSTQRASDSLVLEGDWLTSKLINFAMSVSTTVKKQTFSKIAIVLAVALGFFCLCNVSGQTGQRGRVTSTLQSEWMFTLDDETLASMWKRWYLLSRRNLPPPLVHEMREVSYMTLQPDGVLQPKQLALETYWSDRLDDNRFVKAQILDQEESNGGSKRFIHEEKPLYRRLRVDDALDFKDDEESGVEKDFEESATANDAGAGEPTLPSASVSKYAILSIILLSTSFLIISCAILLYATDIMDRYKYRKDWLAFRHHELHNEGSSACGRRNETVNPPAVPREGDIEEALFHIQNDRCATLSRVSSITNSLADQDRAYVEDDCGVDHLETVLAAVMEEHSQTTGADLEAIVETSHARGLLADDQPSATVVLEDSDDTMEENSVEEFYASGTELVATDAGGSIENVVTASFRRGENEMILVEGEDSKIRHAKKWHEGYVVQKATQDLVIEEERDPVFGFQDDRDSPQRSSDIDEREQASGSRHVYYQNATKDDESLHSASSSGTENYIRDIIFFPIQSAVFSVAPEPVYDLGVDIEDAICPASHPRIVQVRTDSPLLDRVFEGDFILGLNDIDTCGMTAFQILESCGDIDKERSPGRVKMVKFTILSSRIDDLESGSSDCYDEPSFSRSLPTEGDTGGVDHELVSLGEV